MKKYEESAHLPPVAAARVVFRRQKAFVEHCVKQLDDEPFFAELFPGLNSVGVIVQHITGNMRSRWTDFLDADGEKADRDRETEFAKPEGELAAVRAGIMSRWDTAWETLFGALEDADQADANHTVTIRGVPHSIPMAIARQLDHYGFHVGQIATICRGLVGTEGWDWFTLAPGGSAAFNRALGYKTDEGT